MLLVILLFGRLLLHLVHRPEEDEEVPVPTPEPHIPVVELFANVWIAEADQEGLLIFREGQSEHYAWGENSEPDGAESGDFVGLSLREQRSHCEITVESGFPGDFRYQEVLRSIREFLHIEKVEVNLLPHDQTFNYNVNCILFSTPGSQDRDYGLIRRLYQEP